MRLQIVTACLLSVMLTECSGQEDVYFSADGSFQLANYWGQPGELSDTGFHKLRRLECLTVLFGTRLNADDIRYIARLRHLEELELGNAGADFDAVTIEGDLSPLAALKSLESFVLCKKNMRDEDLAFLASLPKVRHLAFNAWTGAGKPHGVTDKSAEILSRAQSLRALVINGQGQLTDRFVSTIGRGLPELQHFDVSSDNLTDESLGLIALRLRKLEWLDIRSDKFTARGVSFLGRLQWLESLWVRSTVSGDCARSLGRLTRIKDLGLSLSNIDSAGFEAIAQLPKLEILTLGPAHVTNEQFSLLRNHPTLQGVALNGRDLTPERTVAVIRSLPRLERLSVGEENTALQKIVDRELKRIRRVRLHEERDSSLRESTAQTPTPNRRTD